MFVLDRTIGLQLNNLADVIEQRLSGQVLNYYGQIHPSYLKGFRDKVEAIALNKDSFTPNRLLFFINTPGGSVETVEKMVEIVRYHYNEVYFIIPVHAMSAGTILSMSGDKIYMDYSSSLGPIDPQVLRDINGTQQYVPALGYLDQVEKLINKSLKGTISDAEFVMLQNQDLGLLRQYEQARDLSVELLKEWLVKYKFKDWTLHQTTNPGNNVTDKEKKDRADDIAKKLGNNKIWHSHGRMIGIDTLRTVLKLEIEDYSQDKDLTLNIRLYNDLLCEFVENGNTLHFIHTK